MQPSAMVVDRLIRHIRQDKHDKHMHNRLLVGGRTSSSFSISSLEKMGKKSSLSVPTYCSTIFMPGRVISFACSAQIHCIAGSCTQLHTLLARLLPSSQSQS